MRGKGKSKAEICSVYKKLKLSQIVAGFDRTNFYEISSKYINCVIRSKGKWVKSALGSFRNDNGSRADLTPNIFIDNARAVGCGLAEAGDGRTYGDNPCPSAQGFVGHYGGLIRNNFIFAGRPELYLSQSGVDGGIAFAQACGARALHNTIAFTSPPFAAIEWRFENTHVDLINNLTTHFLVDRGGTATLTGNLSLQPLSLFADGSRGDLHLGADASAAVDQAAAVAPGLCDDDFDGQTRPMGDAGDIGADEYDDGSGNSTAPLIGDQAASDDESGGGSGGCFIGAAQK